MTDLDTLRRALRARHDHELGYRETPDLGEIMAKGRRLRLRRRLAAAGGAVCAAAIVFGTASGISHLTGPSPVHGQRPAGSTRSVRPPSPHPTRVSTPVPVPTPSGSVAGRPAVPPGQGASSVPVPTPSRTR